MNKKEQNRIRALAWYHKNKEKCLRRQKQWRESAFGKAWIKNWSEEDRRSGKANKRLKNAYWKNPEKYRKKSLKSYWNNREQNLIRMRKWQKSAAGKKWLKEYNVKHKVKTAARYMKRNACRRGELIPKGCEVCGGFPAEGHHQDYNQPLKVQWLCKTHHKVLHNKLRKNLRDKAT